MIKQRIRALERKLAKEIAQIEADKAAVEHVREIEHAKEKDLPPPDPFEFCHKLARTVGYFYRTAWTALEYLYHCIEDGITPDSHKLFLKLLPEEAYV